eukprot:8986045-Pyramimonas_sp.AAC.1
MGAAGGPAASAHARGAPRAGADSRGRTPAGRPPTHTRRRSGGRLSRTWRHSWWPSIGPSSCTRPSSHPR